MREFQPCISPLRLQSAQQRSSTWRVHTTSFSRSSSSNKHDLWSAVYPTKAGIGRQAPAKERMASVPHVKGMRSYIGCRPPAGKLFRTLLPGSMQYFD